MKFWEKKVFIFPTVQKSSKTFKVKNFLLNIKTFPFQCQMEWKKMRKNTLTNFGNALFGPKNTICHSVYCMYSRSAKALKEYQLYWETFLSFHFECIWVYKSYSIHHHSELQRTELRSRSVHFSVFCSCDKCDSPPITLIGRTAAAEQNGYFITNNTVLLKQSRPAHTIEMAFFD